MHWDEKLESDRSVAVDRA